MTTPEYAAFSDALNASSLTFEALIDSVAEALLAGDSSVNVYQYLYTIVSSMPSSQRVDAMSTMILELGLQRAAELGTMREDDHQD
jgi:hypothetical protein